MKFSQTVLIFFMIFSNSSAQENANWQAGFTIGPHSLVNDEMQNIYGNGLSGKLSLTTALHEKARLRVSVSRFNRDGDPFFRSPDFDAGDISNLKIIDFGIGFEVASSIRYPRVNLGAGLNYVLAKEAIVGQSDSNGSDIGAHVYLSPEIQIRGPLLLVFDLSYRFLEMTFKNNRDRYTFDLSGASLLAGVGYIF